MPAARESVTTRRDLFAPAERVWQYLMFYEDVPVRPRGLLRWLLPLPVRSEGDKRSQGALVRCTYERGDLLKRVADVQPGRRLGFEVVEQHLGIERWARAREGSYELEATASGTALRLTTTYETRLRPRALFRPLERVLCHALHAHILLGMERLIAASASAPPGALTSCEEPAPRVVAAPPR